MKKLLLTTVFIIFICNINFAQSKNRIGILVGPNYYSLRGSDFVDDAESSFGYSIGFSFERKFNENFSLVTGLTLDQKKLNYNTQYTQGVPVEFDNYIYQTVKVKTINKYQYFTIPVLFKYNFGKSKSYFLNLGGFISTTGNNKKRTRITNQEAGYTHIVPTTDNYNFKYADNIDGLDCGISFGFGKSFKLNQKTYLLFELRDNLGLINQIEDFNYYGVNDVMKTNTLNLICNLSFDLK